MTTSRLQTVQNGMFMRFVCVLPSHCSKVGVSWGNSWVSHDCRGLIFDNRGNGGTRFDCVSGWSGLQM